MVVGERPNKNLAKGYEKDSMHAYAEAFTSVASAINETVDIYSNARQALNTLSGDTALRNFFVENSCDEPNMTPEEIEEHYNDMENLYLNDREALMEHTTGNQINPLIGMTFPMHKWILMNMVFANGIPRAVAATSKFSITQENRWLIDSKGNRINMFTEQNKMTPAIDATILKSEFEVTLPLTEDQEIVHDKVGGLAGVDHLAIETHVSAVKVADVYFEKGDILPNDEGYVLNGNPIATDETAGEYDVWVPTDFQFVPGFFGLDYDRAFTKRFSYKCKKKKADGTIEATTVTDGITGTLKDDRMNIQSMNGIITDIRVEAMLDPSNARAATCSVAWTEESVPIEIGNAIPINTTISPEEVKDISALYNVNQVTKIMSLMKTALANYKDDKIKESLDISYYKKLGPESKTWNQFDYSPRLSYGLDPVAWRKSTFLDFFDSEVTTLAQRLNDNNVKVAIFGDPDLTRKIEPTDYQFQSPPNIGPIELDFEKTVYTSDKRHYTFIGSDKLRGNNEFIIILNPNKTDRILYRIYDYQMYMSNEIRNPQNPSLPAIHTFERWKFVDYTPVQGRIKILNPRGINAETYNAIPVVNVNNTP